MKTKFFMSAFFRLDAADSLELIRVLGQTFPGLHAFSTMAEEGFDVLNESLGTRNGSYILKAWLKDKTNGDPATVISSDPTKDSNHLPRKSPQLTINAEWGKPHLIEVVRDNDTELNNGRCDTISYTWWIDCRLMPISVKKASGIIHLIDKWFNQPVIPGSRACKVLEVPGAPLVMSDTGHLCRLANPRGKLVLTVQVDDE